MLVDALVEANEYLGIALHAQDPADFWKLDDTIIKSIETAPNDELNKAKGIIQRIRRRELYKVVLLSVMNLLCSFIISFYMFIRAIVA
jgi:hypothetical protein